MQFRGKLRTYFWSRGNISGVEDNFRKVEDKSRGSAVLTEASIR